MNGCSRAWGAGGGLRHLCTARGLRCGWRASTPICMRLTSVSFRVCHVPPRLHWFALALTLYAGITMASSAPFYSGKALDMQHRVPFGVLLLVVVAFVLV